LRRSAVARLVGLTLTLLWLAVSLPAESLAAPSAADALQLAVRPGFGGAVKLGTWVPVELEIQNAGAATVGEVQVQVDGQTNRGYYNRPPIVYRQSVELPSRARKRLTMDVFVPSVDEKLRAQIVSGGQTYAAQEVSFERVAAGELFCGVLTGGKPGLDFLGAIDLGGPYRRPRLVNLDVTDIPSSPILLQSLDCVIMSNLSTASLGDGQRAALDGWVESGGLLVVGGGPGVQKTLAGLPRDLLPIRVSGTVPVRSLAALGRLVGQPSPEQGPWLVGDAVPTTGVQVLEEDGVTLLAAAKHGLGSVVYLGLDPTSEPLRGWTGEETLWRHMLSYAPSPAATMSGSARALAGWGRTPRGAIADIGDFKEGAPLWILYVLAVYGVVIGPLNYVALRRLGHLEWSLATIPLATLLFAGVTFAGARANPAADVVVNGVSVLRSYDGQTAVEHSYLGLFALRDQTADLALPEGSLVSAQLYPYPIDASSTARSPGWSLEVSGEGRPVIHQLSIRSGGLATLTLDGARALPGRVDASLTFDGASVSGQITSHLKRSLKGAGLVVGGSVVRLGELRPNETRPIGVDLTASPLDSLTIVRQLYPTDSDQAPPDEVAARDILQGVLNSGTASGPRVELDAATLVGWVDEPSASSYGGNSRARPVQRTLLVANVPLRPVAGASMEVPSSLIVRRSLTVTSAARPQQSDLVLSNGDSLSYEYRLPFDASQFTVEGLRLDILGSVRAPGADQVANPLAAVSTTLIYDWRRAQWVQLDVAFGQNAIDAPDRFVSPLGVVRLRFAFRAQQSQAQVSPSLALQTFDLAVSGTAR